ncbi:MAG TPA: tyrosine-type recombinase/integrase [Pirellulales bacterium]|nr:tyrosine-type recombinase/integrase [Pirellulales bacterium]
MAGLQFRHGSYRVLFRHHGKQHAFTRGEVSQDEAESKARQVDYLLMRLKQRLAVLPPGMDIVEFVQFDGKPAPTDEPLPEKVTLAQLRDKYLATHEASLEPTTIYGIKLHFNHLTGVLGSAFPIAELQLADLQRYVDRRAKAKGLNKRKLSAATIKKEIVSLRTAWNWGVKMKLVAGRFPYDGLRYPRMTEKPPFQTRAEIERQLDGLSDAEQSELWHCLYLLLPEVDELLKIVKKSARHAWIYPLFVFAAHTGARRSEIIRAGMHDVDFADGSIIIHEKKRVHGSNTTRRVPMTPLLTKALKDWLKVHPGGKHLFCKGAISQNKKRREVSPLTRDEVHDHFRRTLAGTKWENIKGLHCLRHSFCSNLAMRGVDQRMIDELVGHMTPEQQKRYRHLAPHTKAETLKAVFG